MASNAIFNKAAMSVPILSVGIIKSEDRESCVSGPCIFGSDPLGVKRGRVQNRDEHAALLHGLLQRVHCYLAENRTIESGFDFRFTVVKYISDP